MGTVTQELKVYLNTCPEHKVSRVTHVNTEKGWEEKYMSVSCYVRMYVCGEWWLMYSESYTYMYSRYKLYWELFRGSFKGFESHDSNKRTSLRSASAVLTIINEYM